MLAKTYRLERTQFIPRPRDEVFAFFADAGNLQAITPPWLHFRILTPQPIRITAGALIDYQLRLFAVPIRWRTSIEQFDPPRNFVDAQLSGPYALWHHTHEFHEAPGGTRMIDRVDYRIPLGPLGRLAHALFVRRLLKRIFDFRHETIDRMLSSPSRTNAAEVRFAE